MLSGNYRLAVLNKRLAVCYSDCYSNLHSALFSEITVWPQNFTKLYYSPKRYETLQIGPISEFLSNALLIPKLFEIML